MPIKKISNERFVAALLGAPASSVPQMAQELGVSETTIRRHLARLAESGAIIRRWVVEPRRIGIRVQMVFLLQVESKHLMSVANALTNLPSVHFVSIVASNFNILAGAHFQSETQLLDFLVEQLGHLEGVQLTEQIRTLRVLKTSFGGSLTAPILNDGTLPDTRSGGDSEEPVPIDSVDQAILRRIAFSEDTSTLGLARALNLSESAIRRRMAKLLTAGVIAEHTILFPERLGFPLAVHFLFRVDPRQLESTTAALSALPELSRLALIAGESDLAALGHFRSDAHLVNFLTQSLGQISGIERRRVSPVIKTLKALHGGVPILPVDGWTGIQ